MEENLKKVFIDVYSCYLHLYLSLCCLHLFIVARDGGREELPHIQGVVAARAQEGLEEPSHIEGQEWWQ